MSRDSRSAQLVCARWFAGGLTRHDDGVRQGTQNRVLHLVFQRAFTERRGVFHGHVDEDQHSAYQRSFEALNGVRMALQDYLVRIARPGIAVCD